MKRVSVFLLVLVVTSAAQAGYVDTDNYYVMSTLELFQFDGAVSGSVTMEWDGADCTLANITGAEQWWMQFGVTGDTGVFPSSLSGGWKMTITNTSQSGRINLILLCGTAANGWQTSPGLWLDPGQTGTEYLDIAGPNQINWFGFAFQTPETGTRTFTVVNPDGPDILPPSAPTALVAWGNDTIVGFDWANNGETDLAGYNLYRSVTSGGPYTQIASGISDSDYIDTTVVNGTTYYYVVTAVDTLANESGYSVEVSATPMIPDPNGHFIDIDGYYVMDIPELSQFDGAVSGSVTMDWDGSDCTLADITGSEQWWMQFNITGDPCVFPSSLPRGWKMTITNTSQAGSINLILICSTAANGGWQSSSGLWLNPGQTGTAYLDIIGPDQINWFGFIIQTTETGTRTFTALTPDQIKASRHAVITVDAASPIRTIPMTMYGTNLTAWDGSQDGTNTTFNNLMIASGRKYLRMPGGSWANGHLWSDIEGPNGFGAWKVSYNETLNLLDAISVPGEIIHPTLQPIVNFPGWWYETLQDETPGDDVNENYAIAHVNAVNAAVAWVQDQTSRPVCAEYWEIGNEIGGPWEVGYFPEISGTFYGDYFADFSLGMKAVNSNIKIGAVAEPVHKLQEWGWYQGYWTYDTLVAAFAKGVVPDFLIIHQYPGSGADASYNPKLLSSDIDTIGIYTSNLDEIVANAIGQQYVGQVRYCMTEWDTGSHATYNRGTCYINALFHAQYILEMAKYNWEGSNPWIPEFGQGFSVWPVWYVHPLLIHYFGRDMVEASSSNPLVRVYAAKDTEGNLTVFIVNNSHNASITADINISGFLTGSEGRSWVAEPAGSIIPGGVNIQDKGDISINGVVHPDPLMVSAMPSKSFALSDAFTVKLPASCMMLLNIPAAPVNHYVYDETATLQRGKAGQNGKAAEKGKLPATVISGAASGSYADTFASDNVYEAITEVETCQKLFNRYSLLDYTWKIDIGSGGSPVLMVEAYHNLNSEGDDFVFAYSTDNVNFTDVITITKTSDDNSTQSAVLPKDLRGTVYIRVIDTDRTQGNRSLGTVFVDALYIQTISGEN